MDITIVVDPVTRILWRGGWITIGLSAVFFLAVMVLVFRSTRKPVIRK